MTRGGPRCDDQLRNAQELANIAREIGADVLQGALRFSSDAGGWQLRDFDLSEYLDRYRIALESG